MSYSLSRLLITGAVNENTPLCVLTEIADAHGVDCEKREGGRNFSKDLVASINRTPTPKININGEVPKNTLQVLARFINPKHLGWKKDSVLKAFVFLNKFMTRNGNPLEKLPKDIQFGIQTSEAPLSLNACVLYQICTSNNIHLNSKTTFRQMSYAVELLRGSAQSTIRRVKIFIEREANHTNLINMLISSQDEIPDPEGEISEDIDYNTMTEKTNIHDHLSALHHSLHNVQILQQYVEPKTNEGFIALAAIKYGIDISKATNPSIEFRELKTKGKLLYKPIDKWMLHWYNINPKEFDISTVFNPMFPPLFYTLENLRRMALNEGYVNIFSEDPYELLQISHVTDTFYYCMMPNIKNFRTPIDLDEVQEVPYGQLLFYGQKGIGLTPITLTELANLFEANENFSSPFTSDEVFSELAMNKLKSIIRNTEGPNPNICLSSESLEAKRHLSTIINRVEIILRNNDEKTKQLTLLYKNSNNETKENIVQVLNCLLNVGMYMRGWLGEGEYPVVRAVVPQEMEAEVALKTTKEIALFESICESLGNLGKQIYNLPLVIYKDGQYQTSNSTSEGLTIKERLSLVKMGDETNNINSCIRLSSNWICSSAHKYIIALGLPSPFDVFTLRHIT